MAAVPCPAWDTESGLQALLTLVCSWSFPPPFPHSREGGNLATLFWQCRLLF